jgi:hypothetical protein
MQNREVRQKFTDVTEEHSAAIFCTEDQAEQENKQVQWFILFAAR